MILNGDLKPQPPVRLYAESALPTVPLAFWLGSQRATETREPGDRPCKEV